MAETRLSFPVEEAVADEFRRSAGARNLSQGEYFERVMAFLKVARTRAARGDRILAADLAELGLEPVTA
ncbi:MAG TPA: hypothetical protein VI855_06950 [Dehalococcoidia bacterium]|nr:hypothetical protein [Dehalococcoidia bacterium]